MNKEMYSYIKLKILYRRLKTAFMTSASFSEFSFHLGYQGFEAPRVIRCLLARSNWHYAWLSGFYGGGILSVDERLKYHA